MALENISIEEILWIESIDEILSDEILILELTLKSSRRVIRWFLDERGLFILGFGITLSAGVTLKAGQLLYRKLKKRRRRLNELVKSRGGELTREIGDQCIDTNHVYELIDVELASRIKALFQHVKNPPIIIKRSIFLVLVTVFKNQAPIGVIHLFNWEAFEIQGKINLPTALKIFRLIKALAKGATVAITLLIPLFVGLTVRGIQAMAVSAFLAYNLILAPNMSSPDCKKYFRELTTVGDDIHVVPPVPGIAPPSVEPKKFGLFTDSSKAKEDDRIFITGHVDLPIVKEISNVSDETNCVIERGFEKPEPRELIPSLVSPFNKKESKPVEVITKSCTMKKKTQYVPLKDRTMTLKDLKDWDELQAAVEDENSAESKKEETVGPSRKRIQGRREEIMKNRDK